MQDASEKMIIFVYNIVQHWMENNIGRNSKELQTKWILG